MSEYMSLAAFLFKTYWPFLAFGGFCLAWPFIFAVIWKAFKSCPAFLIKLAKWPFKIIRNICIFSKSLFSKKSSVQDFRLVPKLKNLKIVISMYVANTAFFTNRTKVFLKIILTVLAIKRAILKP